jgi:hypothetical protein
MVVIDRPTDRVDECVQTYRAVLSIMLWERSRKRRAEFVGHKTSQQTTPCCQQRRFTLCPKQSMPFFFLANPFRHDGWEKCVLFIWGCFRHPDIAGARPMLLLARGEICLRVAAAIRFAIFS